jgi:cytidylate kinase
MDTGNALIIAIDGPAASGKSTVALSLARRLGLALVDSGSMYRAVTLLAIEQRAAIDDADALRSLARSVSADFKLELPDEGPPYVLLGERDVTREIRLPEVGEAVSPVSRVGSVREEMVMLQRSLVGGRGAVVEGRDIGTIVFPDAPLKVFLEALPEERARRRFLEFNEKGVPATELEVRREIAMRDSIDSTRELSPLAAADDAFLLDTTEMTVEQVVDAVVGELGRRRLV